MAEYLVRDIKLGISATPEATYNALVPGFTDPGGTNTNNYLGFLMTGRGFPLPDKEKQDDTGKIGTGREFPTEQRSGYVVPPTMEITEELNVDIAPIFLRRAMGGTDPTPSGGDILEAGRTFEHNWIMQANDTAAFLQLPSSSIVYALGGADYVFGGCCVESFRIEQTRSQVPTFTANLIGSGLFRRVRELSSSTTGGTTQIETATVVGTITLAGDVEVIVTAAGVTGSPITFTVAVLLGDTAQQVAGKIRTALKASTDLTAVYTVSGTGAEVILTRKFAAANDATLNISIDNDTATGLTTATTSDNTRAGVAGATTHADRPSVPPPAKQNYMLGAETHIQWTTQDGTYFITNVQRLIAFNCTITNALRSDDQRPGDPRITSNSTKAGWYINRMNHGDRTAAAEMTVMLDDALQELIDANEDVPVTNFTYRARGHYVQDIAGSTTSTAFQNTFEIVFPDCFFRAVRGADDNGMATVQIGIFPIDPGTGNFGPVEARIVNNRATAIT